MLCAPNLWTHRLAVPAGTGEAGAARALSSWWGDP